MAKENNKKVRDFLKNVKIYYLATEDGDQPRVRPFGTITLFEDKLYILTSKAKNVSKQIQANPKFELSATDETGKWIRVSGTLEEDNRTQVQSAVLEEYPNLKSTYTVGGENTQTLYFKDAVAVIYSFTDEPEILNL